MKRREALKNLLIVTGGVIVLPACLHERTEASIPLKHLKITAEQEKQLATLAETIIPTTNTPGAKDTYAHVFALKMIDDCYDKASQETFIKGVQELDAISKDRFQTAFLKATPTQREQLVSEWEKQLAANNTPPSFYKLFKDNVVRGYLGSKQVMGDIMKYELVPGRYVGAAPVQTIKHQI